MELPNISPNDRSIIASGEGALSSGYRRNEPKDATPIVDLWPAYASGSIVGPEHASISRATLPAKIIAVKATHAQIESKRKPKFLQELENFVAREMKAVASVKDDRSRDLKLQIYREVFEVLIEDFRAYRGILASIKNEYELMIAYLRQRIRDLEPLQQLMMTQAAQHEQKLLQKEQSENEEIENLHEDNRKLRQRIANFRQDELAWREQIRKLEEDISVEHKRYREEHDARKMLIADINDLRNQQEEAQQQAAASKNKDDSIEEDLQLLNIALKNAKAAEAEATRKLNKMVADYADVVPRRDFERLENDHEKVKESLETTGKDFSILHNEHQMLQETYRKLQSEYVNLSKEYEEHKETSTPRPTWSKASGVIYGGAAKWQMLSDGKSSDQMLDVMIDELKKTGGFSDESAPAFFVAKGNDLAAPIFLRTTGKVRNRRLGQRDLLFEIHSFWKQRMEIKAKDRAKDNISEFFFRYLKERSLNDTMLYEWAYNIFMASQRHHDDERARLFYNIVSGQMDEEIYHHQRNVIQKVKSKFEEKDTLKEGTLSEDTMRWLLAGLFPEKTEQRIDALMRAAKLQVNWQADEGIDYQHLFSEDDEGGFGQFVNEIKEQITLEREEFVESIMQHTSGRTLLDPYHLEEAIRGADSMTTEAYVERYCCWAYSTVPEELANSPALPAQDIREKLLNGCVYRAGRSFV